MNKIFAPFLPPWVETGLQPAFYDMESGTVLQQTARMYAKVQQLTRLFNEFSEDVSNEVNNFEHDINETVQEYINKFVELKDFVDDYFDNLDVQEEINNKLDAMAEDGTLAQIVKEYLAIPQGNTIALKRIGRKLEKGTNTSSSTHSALGAAHAIQGGAMVDENTVAYALWDSLNPTLNKNKIVLMNINTGVISATADFTFGWCNSIAYNDGKLYIAVRGSYVGGVATNNGKIEILNASTLALEDEIEMPFNVNAIAFKEGKFYLLQESSGNISIYDDTLTDAIGSIATGDSSYHQDIEVDGDYLYILSSSPMNVINVYDMEGSKVRCYNLPIAGGRFKLGETQFISKYGDDMLIGTVCTQYELAINQFFITNFATNIDTDELQIDALTVYCNSEVDYYDADGSSAKPFTQISEANYVNIDNIIIDGNNKSYDYVYLSNKKYCRIINSTMSEGAYLQYGTYALLTCTIDYSINTSINACLFIRNVILYSDQVTYDGDNKANLINSNIFNTINLNRSTFSNYTTRVFTGANRTTNLTIDNTDNVGFIPNLYNKPFNLCPNSDLTAWAVGDTPWTNDYTETQFNDLYNNCSHIIVGYIDTGGNTVTEKVIKKTLGQTDNYEIKGSNVSGASVNIRLSKCQFQIRNTGLRIVTDATNTIDKDGTRVSTPNADNSIVIKYVKLVNM